CRRPPSGSRGRRPSFFSASHHHSRGWFGHNRTLPPVPQPNLNFSIRSVVDVPLTWGRYNIEKREGIAVFEILVVEDDVHTQKLISAVLKRGGYRATVAGNGLEALDRMETRRFDLIVLDLMMPGMDG